MKLASTITLALLGGILAAASPATARMADPGLKAPSLIDQVACRTVRERIGGVWRMRRVCAPVIAPRRRCVTERQRVVRPNGTVVVKSVRRCR